MKKPFLGVLALLLCYAISFAGDITIWVPPYGIKKAKDNLERDFGGIQMKDAITALALQFWVPDTDRVVFKSKYAGKGADSLNAETVKWFADWGKRNNVPVLLCIYNSPGWDWFEVRATLVDTIMPKFVKAMVDTMDRYELDGVDIDYEGNSSNENYALDELLADSTAFFKFSKLLADSVHARDGKMTKIAVFADKYNVPSVTWWRSLLKIYDNVESMGYKSTSAPLTPRPGDTAAKRTYDMLIDSALSAGEIYAGRMMLGFPSDTPIWKGIELMDNLDWFLENHRITDSTSVGLCIWDAQLKETSIWHQPTVWNKLAQISADVRAKKAVPFDSSCTRTPLPGRFNLRYQKSYLSGHQKNNYVSQGGAWQVGDKVVPKGRSCSEAMEVVEPQEGDSMYVRLAGKWPRTDVIRFEFEKVTWPAPEDSTAVSAKNFALPGFRAGATVYGVTGKALLRLPEGEWASAEQVRDAVRGRLPSGVYLVKFDGIAQALKLSLER